VFTGENFNHTKARGGSAGVGGGAGHGLTPCGVEIQSNRYIQAFADALPYPASWTRTFLSASLAARQAGSSCAGIGRAKKKP
jgi:hypothetical protein